MVDSAANVLLGTLRDLLIEEVKFLSGVSGEVKKVEADLRTIHALLMEADANKGRSDSPTFRNCIAELKELAFKAENVLETYAVEVESKKEGKSLKKKIQRVMGILCECYSVHQVGNEIDDIRSGLADLTARLSSMSGGGEGSSNSADQEQKRLLRLSYPHEDDKYFVGMEKDIDSVVSMVKDESPNTPSVISICGMGGLGKTTLARKIYHHPDVQGGFDGLSWVCVTQQFQAETILREIFKQIDGKKSETIDMGLPELVPELHKVLVQRKCLIAIDDIWQTRHWDILKKAFPTNCKVVLTTRNENIASDEGHVYKLGYLSEDEGWELLGKIALPTHVLESRSKLFEKIGRQMVQDCGRLPLAISVIGGILRQKQQILAEWEMVSSKMNPHLRNGGEGYKNNEKVKQVLDLSFDVLPYYLKPCFLYLACFPEDQEIDTEQLYLLWLAEGLISSEEKGNEESLRDVAERYLTELAFRCMVQVEKGLTNAPHSKFESCRLHDLMRDLCSSKAEEEKFIKRVDISKHQQDIPSPIGASIHRLAINLGDATTLCKKRMQEVKDLRSYLVLCKNHHFRMRTTDSQNIVDFENSKHLKILVLDGFKFNGGNLPSTIGKLIHLKYLSLRRCDVKVLPQHVCDLPYLQTLDLRVENNIILPKHIWRMKRLRHLFFPSRIEVIGGDKLKLDGLNELETLKGINSKSARIADIINLKNLRILSATIEDVDSLSKIVDYMSNNRCQLRETNLTVQSCDLRNIVKMLMIRSLIRLEIRNCEIGCSFPSYKQGMCHNLVKLAIQDSKIGGDVVEVLGKYPMLQSLWLEGEFEEVVKTEMRFGANSFPELKYLYLNNLMNLNKWEVEKGAMPKLRKLWILGCINLEKLPDGVRFISTLQSLQCWGMSEELKGRMRGGANGEGGGQDYAYFSHIPSIVLM